jgi:hypothetical protein
VADAADTRRAFSITGVVRRRRQFPIQLTPVESREVRILKTTVLPFNGVYASPQPLKPRQILPPQPPNTGTMKRPETSCDKHAMKELRPQAGNGVAESIDNIKRCDEVVVSQGQKLGRQASLPFIRESNDNAAESADDKQAILCGQLLRGQEMQPWARKHRSIAANLPGQVLGHPNDLARHSEAFPSQAKSSEQHGPTGFVSILSSRSDDRG